MDLIKPTPREIRELGTQNVRQNAQLKLVEQVDICDSLFEQTVKHICINLGREFKQIGNHFEIYFDNLNPEEK